MSQHWILLTLCTLALLSCAKKAEEAADTENAATPVQVAAATTGPIDRVVEADAVLWPVQQASLTPKISAPVKQFFVNRGDHVKAGQLVATLENRDLVAAERESTANLEQAQAGFRTVSQATVLDDQTKAQSDVTAAKEALDAAQKVYGSRVDLLNQGAIARKLVDDAKVVLVQAQTANAIALRHLETLQTVGRKEQIVAAQAQVDAARARTQSTQAQISYSELHSPIDGVVADRSVFPGEMAAAGTPLMTIVEISQVIAKANLPVNDAADVKVGMPATISFNGEDTPGKVTVVSPAVDANTTTVQVWVQAQNPGERLKPGAAVHIAIHASTLQNVTLIPAAALLNSDEGGQKVMVVDAKLVAHDRPVQVGVRQGDKAQIVKGLAEGEQVVTVGGLGLDDKSKVKISAGKEEEVIVDNAPRTETVEREHWTARHAKPVIFLILTFVAIGVYLAFAIPVAVFPETDFPRILVGLDNGVAPINQMQATVTRPVEEALNSVPGLEYVRSITSRGTAEINLFFDWSSNMYQTLNLVNAALSGVRPSLPSTTNIVANRLTFAAFPILGYSLTSENIPQTRLWELATYTIKPRLNRLPGVSTVIVQGGRQPEFHIIADPSKMLQTQVTVQSILDAISKSNLIDSPGLFENNHQLVLSLVSGQAVTPDEIADIVIKTSPAGTPIRVGDIAEVQNGVLPIYTVVTANGKPAVLLNINRQPAGNTVAVADAVYQELDSIKKSLPPGVQISSFYDQSELVRDSIRSVRDAILIGLVLAGIILVLFLRDWGSSLVAGLVIPATVAITLVALRLFGQSFNLMTLGGLAAAVGLVIDDAIVVVENIVLHRDAGLSRGQAIRSAMREIWKPLVGSTVTPIVVFVPLITIAGVTGVFFRALAITVGVALLTSLALALTWTPTLSHFLLRRRGASGEAHHDDSERRGIMGRIVNAYEWVLTLTLARPIVLILGSAVVIAGGYYCYDKLGSDLLPEMDEGGFILDYLMPAGSSLEETNRVISDVEKILRNTKEVASTSRRTGLQLGLAAVTEANRGDISVKLKRDRDKNFDEITSPLRKEINAKYPQLDIEFPQVLQDMIGDLTGSPEPIEIKLFSQSPDELNTWAPRVADAIKKLGPVKDVKNGIENTISGPAVIYHVDPVVAARSGFSPQEVETDVSATMQGEPAPTPVVLNDRPYTLRVLFPPSSRASVQAIQNTLLVSSTGKTATLGTLSHIEEQPGQTEIRRENLQRDVAVTGRFEGISLGKGIEQVQQAVAKLGIPGDIRVQYGGTYEEQQKSFHDLLIVLMVAIVLVFIVLLFEFGSFSAPISILLSALLSTAGVFVALLVTGTTFNISSFMGVIMVVGIVAKNGILLLDADQKFRAEGASPREAMIKAGERRLRPIMMTAMATIAGMIPLALGIGAGSQMLQPLAIAVIGGILASMILSLIVTPAAYYGMSGER